MRGLLHFPIWLCFLLGSAFVGYGGDAQSAKENLERLFQISPRYRQAALNQILAEANNVASALQLENHMPITETNLLGSYITPPRMGQGMGAVGNITTSNYTYYVSVGRKLSFIEKHFDDVMNKDFAQLKSEYLWPVAKLDTNAAYQLATQFLAAASMDVRALNRDCRLSIDAFTPEGKSGAHFVPLYWLSWKQKATGTTPVATVEVFLPTKSLRQMRVNDAKYILRSPIAFTNLAELLSQPSDTAKPNTFTPR